MNGENNDGIVSQVLVSWIRKCRFSIMQHQIDSESFWKPDSKANSVRVFASKFPICIPPPCVWIGIDLSCCVIESCLILRCVFFLFSRFYQILYIILTEYICNIQSYSYKKSNAYVIVKFQQQINKTNKHWLQMMHLENYYYYYKMCIYLSLCMLNCTWMSVLLVNC